MGFSTTMSCSIRGLRRSGANGSSSDTSVSEANDGLVVSNPAFGLRNLLPRQLACLREGESGAVIAHAVGINASRNPTISVKSRQTLLAGTSTTPDFGDSALAERAVAAPVPGSSSIGTVWKLGGRRHDSFTRHHTDSIRDRTQAVQPRPA